MKSALLGVSLSLALMAGFAGRSPAEDVPKSKSPVMVPVAHSAPVLSVAFSPDGKTLVSSGMDNRIKLWDVASGKELKSLAYPGVEWARFSPDGKMLVSRSHEATIKLWDVASLKTVRTIYTGGDELVAAAISPDGKTLATGYKYQELVESKDMVIRLWNVASGKELRSLHCQSVKVQSMIFSPDSKTLAAGYESSIADLFNAASGKVFCALACDAGKHDYTGVFSLSFSDDGKTIACGSSSINLWHVLSGKMLFDLPEPGQVYSVAFSPDQKSLASGGDKGTSLWNLASRKNRKFPGHNGAVYSVAFSPNGKILASSGADGTIRLWDVASGKDLRDFAGEGLPP